MVTTTHIRSTQREYTQRLADALARTGYVVAALPCAEGVLCRIGERIHGLALRTYSTRRTLVWRWHVNHLVVFKASRRHWLGLGVPAGDPVYDRYRRRAYWEPPQAPRLELSALECELGSITDWLPSWIAAREFDAPRVPSPVPMRVNSLWQDNYAWTLAADETYTAEYEARRKARESALDRTRGLRLVGA